MANTFFDGFYYAEDVAAARIKNKLSHEGVTLTSEQTEDIARTIMGVMASYTLQDGSYKEFTDIRKEKWGLL